MDPPPFVGRPGFLGWLQSCLRDRVAWRAVGYLAFKAPLALLGVFVAFSLWWDAFACLLHPLFANGGGPPVFGVAQNLLPVRSFDFNPGFFHEVAIFIIGAVFFFAAPWVMRGFVNVDRLLIVALTGPVPMTERVRSLEQAGTRRSTPPRPRCGASSATSTTAPRPSWSRSAMRLGMAKRSSRTPTDVDLDRCAELVDEAHRGAKEAIAELRDIARGIHPPALDIGLEGALATLAARSAVPTELSWTSDATDAGHRGHRLLLRGGAPGQRRAHAQASRASVSCAEHGGVVAAVVRDDGQGGAQLSASAPRPVGWPASLTVCTPSTGGSTS